MPGWNPRKFKVDYENAVINVITEFFPSIEVKGCFYHLNRTKWAKSRELDITRSQDKIIVRMVALNAVLPLLPLAEIMNGWLKKSKQNRHLQLSFLDNVPHHRAGGTNVTPSQHERDANNENGEFDEQAQDSNTTLSISNTEQSNTGQEVEVDTEATEKVPNVVEAINQKKKKIHF